MKTVTKSLCALSLIVPLLAATPGFARGLTVTTNNGGEIAKEHTCIQGNQMVTCETVTTGTNAEGQSVSRDVVRTNTGGSTAVETTLSGPDGGTTTRNRGLIVTR
ncbi:hypothetical protein [Celeribacter sp. PS-C1]|uniref:hypothetical protein n=1 Tax=Celeribacter sp. PS-C1 TaxID=2820813 RepID=UPI001CA52EF3|nr:hypothetical protein [Celeribacter sp. PS-C1]MBW6416626.1 hypothetical protein [Celeribacter sp. PS-C1]